MRSRAAWSAGWPRISIVPESGPRTFITMRRVVVLPAPFGPSRPNTLPRGTSMDRSLTATWPAKAWVTLRRRIAVSFTRPMLSYGTATAGFPLGIYTRPGARTEVRVEGSGGDPRAGPRARERGRLRHGAHPGQARLRERRAAGGAPRRPLRHRVGSLRPARPARGAGLGRTSPPLGPRPRVRRQHVHVLHGPRDRPRGHGRPAPLLLPGDRHPPLGPGRPREPDPAVSGGGGPGLRGLRPHRGRDRRPRRGGGVRAAGRP